MMKQAIRKPDSMQENPRNRKPTNPRAIATSAWMQNAFFEAAHVPEPFSVLASSAPADPADSSIYANTCNNRAQTKLPTLQLSRTEIVCGSVAGGGGKRNSKLPDLERCRQMGRGSRITARVLTWSWPKSNHTWMTSGSSVAFLEISHTDTPSSKREYSDTIAFDAKTYLQAITKLNRKTIIQPVLEGSFPFLQSAASWIVQSGK